MYILLDFNFNPADKHSELLKFILYTRHFPSNM